MENTNAQIMTKIILQMRESHPSLIILFSGGVGGEGSIIYLILDVSKLTV